MPVEMLVTTLYTVTLQDMSFEALHSNTDDYSGWIVHDENQFVQWPPDARWLKCCHILTNVVWC